jgi:hypothetical protein
MAHYAFLDENNIVTEVIAGIDEGDIDYEQLYGEFRGQVCKRTSYNTRGNVHKTGKTPFRGNYAGIGYTYHSDIDAFVPPKPFLSWLLDSNFQWQAFIPMPSDNSMENPYFWNEDIQNWVRNA